MIRVVVVLRGWRMMYVTDLLVRCYPGTLRHCRRQCYKKDLLLGEKDTGETEVVIFLTDVGKCVSD
jgi:hypothetical protein